jgi:hypothetical protein
MHGQLSQQHEIVATQVVEQLVASGAIELRADAERVVDLPLWTLAKNATQVAVVIAALFVAFGGDASPMLTLGYAATAVFAMALVAIADHTKFVAAWGAPDSIDTVEASYEVPIAESHVATPTTWLNGASAYGPGTDGDSSFTLNVT